VESPEARAVRSVAQVRQLVQQGSDDRATPPPARGVTVRRTANAQLDRTRGPATPPVCPPQPDTRHERKIRCQPLYEQ
jgi:hypothetical protein